MQEKLVYQLKIGDILKNIKDKQLYKIKTIEHMDDEDGFKAPSYFHFEGFIVSSNLLNYFFKTNENNEKMFCIFN